VPSRNAIMKRNAALTYAKKWLSLEAMINCAVINAMMEFRNAAMRTEIHTIIHMMQPVLFHAATAVAK
jgi:hypothetical protein